METVTCSTICKPGTFLGSLGSAAALRPKGRGVCLAVPVKKTHPISATKKLQEIPAANETQKASILSISTGCQIFLHASPGSEVGNAPVLFMPQPHTFPDAAMKSECRAPAAAKTMCGASRSPKWIFLGVKICFAPFRHEGGRPMPNLPFSMRPREKTSPLKVTNKVWETPVATLRIGVLWVLRPKHGKRVGRKRVETWPKPIEQECSGLSPSPLRLPQA
mmetsp:Transcript_78804/g.228822  ORF Transcript_78804/g.228822 Transcript_78804/m.228822 type:complete len:220 (-) Transcript_78804:216-875(-)